MAQRPVMASNSARNPMPVVGRSDALLDNRKTGVVLLFSGLFLTFVGAVLTSAGWRHYLAYQKFEWSQLLGPIMLFLGLTFMLISMYKLGNTYCFFCREWDEGGVGESSTGRSGANQPVMLQSAATMMCAPPAYDVINQDVRRGLEFQPGSPAYGVHAASPPHVSAYAAAEEEDSSGTGRRAEKTEDSGSTCSDPPAYEDIYPAFSKRHPT